MTGYHSAYTSCRSAAHPPADQPEPEEEPPVTEPVEVYDYGDLALATLDPSHPWFKIDQRCQHMFGGKRCQHPGHLGENWHRYEDALHQLRWWA